MDILSHKSHHFIVVSVLFTWIGQVKYGCMVELFVYIMITVFKCLLFPLLCHSDLLNAERNKYRRDLFSKQKTTVISEQWLHLHMNGYLLKSFGARAFLWMLQYFQLPSEVLHYLMCCAMCFLSECMKTP